MPPPTLQQGAWECIVKSLEPGQDYDPDEMGVDRIVKEASLLNYNKAG